MVAACLSALVSVAGTACIAGPRRWHVPACTSTDRGDACVFSAAAKRVRIGLPSPDTPGGDVDVFDTTASTSTSAVVALCLESTSPWTGQADCPRSGGMPAFLLRPPRAGMITAVFPGGSIRTHVFDSATSHHLPIPGSARAGYGNGIPGSAATAANGGGLDTYGFEGTAPPAAGPPALAPRRRRQLRRRQRSRPHYLRCTRGPNSLPARAMNEARLPSATATTQTRPARPRTPASPHRQPRPARR